MGFPCSRKFSYLETYFLFFHLLFSASLSPFSSSSFFFLFLSPRRPLLWSVLHSHCAPPPPAAVGRVTGLPRLGGGPATQHAFGSKQRRCVEGEKTCCKVTVQSGFNRFQPPVPSPVVRGRSTVVLCVFHFKNWTILS